MDLPILDISYTWTYRICVSLGLSFTLHAFGVHPWCSLRHNFLPFRGGIRPHCTNRPHLKKKKTIHQLLNICVVSTLGYNKLCRYKPTCACVRVDVGFPFLGLFLRVELLGAMVGNAISPFEGNAKVFPKQTAPFHLPTQQQPLAV